MIQRKQTVFLLLAVVALAVAAVMNTGTVLMLVVLIASALQTFATIFLFNNRKLQAKLALADVLLPLVWYVLLAVLNRQLAGTFVLTWSDALPAVAIMLIFLAYKGIQHDEKLVRSLDRIR